jgi:hypothetical protein
MKSTDVKISTRLGFSFFALIIIMCIIAGIGIKSLLRASEATGEIVGDRQVKVTLAFNTADQVNISAQNLRNAMLARNQQELDLYLNQMEKNSATVGTLLAKIEKLINTQRGQTLLTNVISIRADYTKKRDTIIALLKAQKKQEARSHRLYARYSHPGAGAVSHCTQCLHCISTVIDATQCREQRGFISVLDSLHVHLVRNRDSVISRSGDGNYPFHHPPD